MKMVNGTLIRVTNADIKNGTFSFPEGVKKIGNGVFRNCASLQSISIPEGVDTIDRSAFRGCTSLQSITIPESVKTIGEWTFEGCTSLRSIIISKGVRSIGYSAFSGCTSLRSITIPEGVETIGISAFYGCTSLQGIIIPEGVETIGSEAFYGCTSLQGITLPEGVKTIGSEAFYGCTSLQGITLPEGVKTIDQWTFQGCTSLQSITLPKGVETISESAFRWCKSLQSITIPEGVETISKQAFEGCKSLQSITIPESVRTIEREVFEGCTSLSFIYISSTTAAGHQRIVALLPKELRSRVVPHELTKKLPDMINEKLQRIVLTAHTNPMARSAKNGLPVPEDVLKAMNACLGEDNRFLRKAKRQIAKLPLPADDKGFADYTKKVQTIVDEAIVRSKSGRVSPVMPEVLEHLKRLKDKVLDLSIRGKEEAARALQDLCAELKQHHNALVSGRLDNTAFQEQCKQAIEQKREVLGGHRGAKSLLNPLQNYFKSGPAFLKTDTINLLDALMGTIEKEAPNQRPSPSSR